VRDPATPPDAAWTEWGGAGPVLHFAHANGFPAASYRSLIEQLTGSFQVVSMDARPLWSDSDPAELADWRPLVNDLVVGLGGRGLRGVVGVGHSLGGTLSALAAAADPSLFAALVLVDPVIFTGLRSRLWRLAKRLGRAHRLHLVRGARGRRELWPDRAAVRAAYRAKPTFASWRDRAFDDYLEAGFVAAAGGGVRLRYPRSWEARIFEVCPADLWLRLRTIRVPVLFLRGETSDTFLESAARRAMREIRRARVEVVAGTSHLLPMERPETVAAAIDGFAREVLG
jgi:pimeloyl-ACP methyl ester carboxylesterase